MTYSAICRLVLICCKTENILFSETPSAISPSLYFLDGQCFELFCSKLYFFTNKNVLWILCLRTGLQHTLNRLFKNSLNTFPKLLECLIWIKVLPWIRATIKNTELGLRINKIIAISRCSVHFVTMHMKCKLCTEKSNKNCFSDIYNLSQL